MLEYYGSFAPAMATSLAEMAMEADAEAISADSSSWLEYPWGAWRRRPQKRLICRASALCQISRAPSAASMATDSKGFDPRRDTSGLWLVATMRRSQP